MRPGKLGAGSPGEPGGANRRTHSGVRKWVVVVVGGKPFDFLGLVPRATHMPREFAVGAFRNRSAAETTWFEEALFDHLIFWKTDEYAHLTQYVDPAVFEPEDVEQRGRPRFDVHTKNLQVSVGMLGFEWQ